MFPIENLRSGGKVQAKIYTPEGAIRDASGKIIRFDDNYVRDAFVAENLVPEEGLHHMLDVLYNSKSQGAYYCALKADAGVPADNWAYSDNGTLYTEFAGYDEAPLRQTWDVDPAASKQVINPTAMSFTITSNSSTVNGAMLVTNATVSDNTSDPGNVLLSVLNFGSAKALDAAEVLQIQYSFGITSA